jgi:hypothetical protein
MSHDTMYLKELEHVRFHPVFILGVHRSGTSILYQLLAHSGCFNIITAYHIINYDRLLFNFFNNLQEKQKNQLTQCLNRDGVLDRGIDSLKISADFAEEYGFLLAKKTKTMSISNHNVDVFKQLCKKVQFLSKNNKPILLKNPSDFSNFLFLKQTFPTAKFIFIHRHPLHTITSMLNALKKIIQEKNAYTAKLSPVYNSFYANILLRYPLRFIFCIVPYIGVILISKITANATQYYLNNIDTLSSDDYISITYEQLCLHPQECLESIMNKFSFPIINSYDATALIKPRQVPLNNNILKLRRYILNRMKKYCKKFNYF